ncbi:hypothetical protein QCA50_004456 [Cerrena zonata]|uniref:Tyrosine specific protein phosphatases domain-containing protein n=1 Tax=Cerrena zonata TaxID=2478898 RepID=A0AAW0GTM3_9APHY
MSTTYIQVTVDQRLEKPTIHSGRSSVNSNKVQWEELLAAQLSPLASLHHRSYYSRLRFGPEGCSMTYVPLSIHMPERVKELQAIQTEQATQQAWWRSKCSSISLDGSRSRPSSSRSNPLLSHTSSHDNLQEELLDAMQSPLALDPTAPSTIPPHTPVPAHAWKTSDSHPINISMLIPPELLQIISTHLTPKEGFRPTMFDVPPSHRLYHLLDRYREGFNSSNTPQTAANVRAITLATTNQRNSSTRSDIVSVLWKQTFSKRKSKAEFSSKVTYTTDPTITDKRSSFDIKPIRRRLSPSKRDTSAPVKTPKPITIGNLFMSSCPGKKVRLDGPVNGRSAVRRDLAQDLMRMWQAGVRCIVCCLDDEELEYLGAPWPEYCRIADEIGIDLIFPGFVHRLPIPEGLAPLDPSILDNHLTRLINTYTLNGHHTLVHCRGGVGRAGLVACSWMLKLGLCGWVNNEPTLNCEIEGSGLRRDTLLLVERALWIVRKRRSPKAIETYEQVKFLVDYVDFLRQDQDMGSEGSAEVAEFSSKVIDSVLDFEEPAWKVGDVKFE